MSRKPKPKKRGRKPGVKVGPYKKRKHKLTTVYGNTISLDQMDKMMGYEKATEPNILTLCGQIEDTIDTLAARLTSINARILGLL